MATCNGERWLDAQLDSILAQLASDDELVIVDDASTDSTRERIAARADARIRLTANATNLGVRASFERALTLVRGEFIFLADQDDVWLPDKRAALVEELESGALLALGDATVIDGEGRAQASSFMAWRGGFRGSFTATLWKNRYLGCALAFRRALLARALPIPADVPMHDMWIGALAACSGRVAYVDRPLMQYRRHGGNLSPAQPQALGTRLRWRGRLATRVLGRVLATPRPHA
jgi:glycosyltransferase involved in cell wall biosynthesis